MNEEILTKAIEKAIANGWFMDYSRAKDKVKAFHRAYTIEDDGIHSKKYECMECYTPNYPISEFIYDHSFAKALWGEDNYYRYAGDTLENPKQWQWHLQQMVIAEDPIKYLGEHL